MTTRPGHSRRRRAARRRLGYEQRIVLLAFGAAAPAVVSALVLLWSGPHSPKLRITLTLLVVGAWLACAYAIYEVTVYRLRTLANLLEALREGDYSLRGRTHGRRDAMAEVVAEVNALGEALRRQRLDAQEATALLRRVLAEIDVAVLVFDESRRLRLINRQGERVLGRPMAQLLDRTAAELGLASCMDSTGPHLRELVLPGAAGRWQVQRSLVREDGRPHELVVLSDLTHALREEERQAWRRLIQVLRHEINNSLAPIQSLAGSLAGFLARRPPPPDLEQDLAEGLGVIAERSQALGRFMASYTKLARLPAPCLSDVDVDTWVRRITGLETRLPVQVEAGPSVVVQADGDQLDQLLINLVSNAVEATMQSGGGGVRVSWAHAPGGGVEVWIDDDGPGLTSTENLFVPFYTTKPSGSGVGLALCRQIAEAHGGVVTLQNRSDGCGCRATVRLPAADRDDRARFRDSPSQKRT